MALHYGSPEGYTITPLHLVGHSGQTDILRQLDEVRMSVFEGEVSRLDIEEIVASQHGRNPVSVVFAESESGEGPIVGGALLRLREPRSLDENMVFDLDASEIFVAEEHRERTAGSTLLSAAVYSYTQAVLMPTGQSPDNPFRITYTPSGIEMTDEFGVIDDDVFFDLPYSGWNIVEDRTEFEVVAGLPLAGSEFILNEAGQSAGAAMDYIGLRGLDAYFKNKSGDDMFVYRDGGFLLRVRPVEGTKAVVGGRHVQDYMVYAPDGRAVFENSLTLSDFPFYAISDVLRNVVTLNFLNSQ